MQQQPEIVNFPADGYIIADCMKMCLPPVNLSLFFLTPVSSCREMDILYQCKDILKIQKFRRLASYAGFYAFTTLVTYAYTSNTYFDAEVPFFAHLQHLPTYYLTRADVLRSLNLLQDKGWHLEGRSVLRLLPFWY